jgi:hypothetical protein
MREKIEGGKLRRCEGRKVELKPKICKKRENEKVGAVFNRDFLGLAYAYK